MVLASLSNRTVCSAFAMAAAIVPTAVALHASQSAATPLEQAAPSSVPTAAALSAERSLDYLRQVMDQFHDRFPVYDDVSSAGNHFHAWAKLPGASAPVTIDGSWTANPHSGATAIRCRFTPTSAFGGFYFQNGTMTGEQTAPQPNFGTVANAGVNLSGAVALTFWARGVAGGERIDVFVAGVGRDADTGVAISPHPDSSPRIPARGHLFTLTQSWQQFRIDLAGRDMSYVLGGLGWVADSAHNPQGVEFFLDDIQYELGPARRSARLEEPRFLRSYTTLPLQPDPFDGVADGDIDFVLRNMAFAYDNALALLAFLAEGTADGLRRARLIGDAFLYAMQYDRTYNDNRSCSQPVDVLSVDGARIRSAYAAGDIALPPGWTPKGRVGTVPLPGFYAEATQTFYEVEQQAVDVGNTAWVAIALRSLYQRTGQASYLDATCKLANFIHAFRNDVGTYQGFTGGIDSPETTPVRRSWASSEHNLDVHALMTGLFRITGESRWLEDATHAREFMETMWNTSNNCYVAGTRDPNTRNADPGQLPLDVQPWSVLSLPDGGPHAEVLDCAGAHHLTSHAGFTGYDFNDDKDGVWFEGTAQMAVAFAVMGRTADVQTLRQQLQLAQQTDPFGDTRGIASTSRDGLTTGFLTVTGDPFKYFRRLHIAVAAWNVFGQLAVNPYYDPGSFCKFTLSPAAVALDAGASAGHLVNITAPGTGCPWMAIADATKSWLTIDGPASGMGSGTISLRVAANAGYARAAFPTVAGLRLQATQASGCLSSPGSCRRMPGDVDRDGQADLILFRPSTGTWHIRGSNSSYSSTMTIAWGVESDRRVPGDYDGDGATDIAIFRPFSAEWWILLSSSHFTAYAVYHWGVGADVPVPADYDGDGKTDIAVYRPWTGEWWILRSSTSFTTFAVHYWGTGADVPVPGDYDGDQTADLAVYRPSTSAWWILQSSTSFTSFAVSFWGVSTDVPVPEDYDGDRTTDVAVYRPSTGQWWVLMSTTNSTMYFIQSLGIAGDIPVPSEVDGDQTADIAVYRPSTGEWFARTSATSFTSVLRLMWGLAGDLPVSR